MFRRDDILLNDRGRILPTDSKSITDADEEFNMLCA